MPRIHFQGRKLCHKYTCRGGNPATDIISGEENSTMGTFSGEETATNTLSGEETLP